MNYAPGYPVQVQADNENAEDSAVRAMCMVYDRDGLITVFEALTKAYRHVIAWDCDGNKAKEYDNR
jgi:hypothetical protein